MLSYDKMSAQIQDFEEKIDYLFSQIKTIKNETGVVSKTAENFTNSQLSYQKIGTLCIKNNSIVSFFASFNLIATPNENVILNLLIDNKVVVSKTITFQSESYENLIANCNVGVGEFEVGLEVFSEGEVAVKNINLIAVGKFLKLK